MMRPQFFWGVFWGEKSVLQDWGDDGVVCELQP